MPADPTPTPTPATDIDHRLAQRLDAWGRAQVDAARPAAPARFLAAVDRRARFSLVRQFALGLAAIAAVLLIAIGLMRLALPAGTRGPGPGPGPSIVQATRPATPSAITLQVLNRNASPEALLLPEPRSVAVTAPAASPSPRTERASDRFSPGFARGLIDP